MEENRLKRCLKGGGVDSGTPGGGWICLSVAGCHTQTFVEIDPGLEEKLEVSVT